MITRRRFVQLAALSASALAASSSLAESRIPLGAQLYTVRKMAAQNLAGTLDQIDAIGYTEVELTNAAYNYSPGVLRQIVSASGLRAPSAHFSYQNFESRFPYAHALGLQWMVCPMIPNSMWNEAGFHHAAERLNFWGQEANYMGMRLAFHNHNYEFHRYGPQTGFEILVQNTDPQKVSFEMDCYWVAQAGLNPVTLMKRLGSRVQMLHLKDRKPGFPTSTQLDPSSFHFTPVGRGSLDWSAILAEARKIGVEHYFVEQDETSGPPMQALRVSYDYLHKLTA